MAKVTVSTRRVRTVRERRRHAHEALVASGVAPAPMLSNYDLTRGTAAERYWYEQSLAAGHENFSHDAWPCESAGLDATEAIFRDDAGGVVFRASDGSLVLAALGGGWMHVRVAALDPSVAPAVFASFRSNYPASYLTQAADPRVPITFWANSNFGPTARLRRVDSANWSDITGNYAADVEAKLGDLMSWTDGPPSKDGGQLILWQGPPGTGKSWGLRALASEWAPWAEFHYITDPDSFFVDDPSYMIQVLLADSYQAIDEPTGDIYNEQRDGKWRILILEDTGELLSATAKEKYGQGLSRLLNVVDGMIGQGLKVLALVTTNDELGDLHPAVTRPGRCAMQIEFGPLTDEEARAWTGNESASAGTIAELYSAYGKADAAEALPADDVSELVASADDRAANDVRAAIFQVASEHQPGEPGYGQAAYAEEDGTVYWIAWDGTSADDLAAVRDAMLAVDGVDAFVYEYESTPSGWWDAELVYPEDAPRWVAESPGEQAAALAEAVALASQPLLPAELRERFATGGIIGQDCMDRLLSVIENLSAAVAPRA